MYYAINELYHHGIKGQKWGVRRYQNPDGTLTEEGKRRYERYQRSVERGNKYIHSAKSGYYEGWARPQIANVSRKTIGIAGVVQLGKIGVEALTTNTLWGVPISATAAAVIGGPSVLALQAVTAAAATSIAALGVRDAIDIHRAKKANKLKKRR